MDSYSVSDLQRAMESGEESSQSLVRRALNVAHKTSRNNAFITIDRDRALETARVLDRSRASGRLEGPLHGIPVVIKDNIHVADLPNTAGTPALRNFIPRNDATAIARLRSAGAVILGKTNMHELAYGVTSSNASYGVVGNISDNSYIAGGSSGGTAVAIASGVVAVGLGTDTGGSSRIPAALNGIVGFRPTVGRYPSDGVTAISNTRDTIGPMANSVSGVLLLDCVLQNLDDCSKPISESIDLANIRIGVPRSYFFDNLAPDISASIDALLAELTQAGVTLIEADLVDIATLNEKVGFPIVLYETRVLLREYLGEHVPDMSLKSLADSIASEDVRSILQTVVDGAISASDYREALNVYRPRLQALYRNYFADKNVDAIIFPTTPIAAVLREGNEQTVTVDGEKRPTFQTYIQNTDPGSNAGIPGLSIPLSRTKEGFFFGVEIDGPEGSDNHLLAIGTALERLIESGGYGEY